MTIELDFQYSASGETFLPQPITVCKYATDLQPAKPVACAA